MDSHTAAGPMENAARTHWPERRTLPEDLAARLRAARLARGVGLREAARRAGIYAGYLCLLEQGKRCPSLAVAQDLAQALDLEREFAAELLKAARRDAGRSRQTEFSQQKRRDRAAGRGDQRRSLGGAAYPAAGTARSSGGGSD